MNQTARKTLAVWKFASCDGCQLNLLDLEDAILLLPDLIDIAYFPEASSQMKEGPYDLSLVEGSVTTAEDCQRIQEIRKQSRTLVTIGACATAGGIQALRNFSTIESFMKAVYARPDYISTLDRSTPISMHVKVDYELRGCPINKYQLLELITSYLSGKKPAIANESVCVECKRRGQICILVAKGTTCLGPLTHAGCGALCPGYDRGCYGCYGPKENANTQALADIVKGQGESQDDLRRLFRSFNAAAEPFAKESLRHEP